MLPNPYFRPKSLLALRRNFRNRARRWNLLPRRAPVRNRRRRVCSQAKYRYRPIIECQLNAEGCVRDGEIAKAGPKMSWRNDRQNIPTSVRQKCDYTMTAQNGQSLAGMVHGHQIPVMNNRPPPPGNTMERVAGGVTC